MTSLPGILGSGARGPTMIEELVTQLVEQEQAVLQELVRLAELSTAQAIAEPAFAAAATQIRAQLRAHAAKVDELELLASEQDRAADIEEARRHASRHRKEGATLQASLRDLGGKVRAGRAQQEAAERSALLLGSPSTADGAVGDAGQGKKMSDRAATQAARDVTASLRRTRQLMVSELQRGDATLQSLDGQAKTIQDTLQEQKGITSSARSGKAALGRLQRRDCTDKVLIAIGFVFFLLVVLHIVKKRLGLGLPAAAEPLGADTAPASAGVPVASEL